jgi:hypothetical protein
MISTTVNANVFHASHDNLPTKVPPSPDPTSYSLGKAEWKTVAGTHRCPYALQTRRKNTSTAADGALQTVNHYRHMHYDALDSQESTKVEHKPFNVYAGFAIGVRINELIRWPLINYLIKVQVKPTYKAV